jgi:hypothetical protein
MLSDQKFFQESRFIFLKILKARTLSIAGASTMLEHAVEIAFWNIESGDDAGPTLGL